MKYYHIETQMRAGSHYLMNALAQVYRGRVAKIKDNSFKLVDQHEINTGLYEAFCCNCQTSDYEAIIFHNHYFHELPEDDRVKTAKKLYLIGYPFDSFYSDGLIFSSPNYSVAPSKKNKRYQEYRLCYQSKEWNFLEPFIQKNAAWLERLQTEDQLVIRYEDFFLNFHRTIEKIQDYFALFQAEFPQPIINTDRLYWTDNYFSKMDQASFEKLSQIFSKGIEFFYPEKEPFNKNHYAKRIENAIL